MGEVIRFISKAERERLRMIRDAQAIYEGVFPPADSVTEALGRTANAADAGALRGELLP
jgi:hypothetical protein